jgi:signal transduction histidine kinase
LTVGPLQGESQAGVLLTLDEVTEQVQMEERLIQQDRLASVGMLAAGVAHEVNTPLTGISSFAQLLLEEAAPNSPQRSTLEKIVQQAGRAARIARDLLRLSRPVAAVGELSSSPVVLSELVEETLGLLMPQIRRAGVVIEREWNPSLAPAWGDRSRLQQVLMNLVLNALDAVGESGTIQVRLIAEGARHVALEVVDDGPGIPDAVRSRIFDPFFTTKKAGAGTGLGLSISYAIVREHGGVLSAESRPGGGTTMRVVLPAAASVVADSRAS